MSNKGKQQQPQQKAQPSNNKLTYESLISSLLDQGFQVLDKKDVPTQEKKLKAVAALHNLIKDKLKAPRDYKDYPKDAISFNLQLQMNTGLTALNSKKVMSLIFTFLIEELTNWQEYGVPKEEVHPDYILPEVTEEEFRFKDISPEEYQAWQQAFNFLRQGINDV